MGFLFQRFGNEVENENLKNATVVAKRDAISIVLIYGFIAFVIVTTVQEPLPSGIALIAFLVFASALLHGVFYQKAWSLLIYLTGQGLLFSFSIIIIGLAFLGLILESYQISPVPDTEAIKKMTNVEQLQQMVIYYRGCFLGVIGLLVIILLTVLQWQAFKAMRHFYNEMKAAGPNEIKNPTPPV